MSSSSAILDAGLPDNNKVLVDANHPTLGAISLHASQIMEGFGNNKMELTASYQPQSGLGSNPAGSTFDIVIPPSRGTNSVAIIDKLILELSIQISSPTAPNNVTLKPCQQWLQRVQIMIDGGNDLQNVYFDEQFIRTVMNSNKDNLDCIKDMINTDPNNFLPWFDERAQGYNVNYVVDPGPPTAEVLIEGQKGRSTYLSNAYFESGGTLDGSDSANELALPPTVNGYLNNYYPFAKGGALISGDLTQSGARVYKFYIPIFNTILQTSKILMNKLTSNIRMRFYMNNELVLYDSGVAPNLTSLTLNNANLWVQGASLSIGGLALMDQKYLVPVVSSFPYYLEYIQDFDGATANGSYYEAILSSITGYASSLTFYLEDTRTNIAYPQTSGNGVKYINNNMMTLPMAAYQFIDQSGQIVGSGNPIDDKVTRIFNTFRQTPVSTYANDLLYFRRYYRLDFNNNPITTISGAVYGNSSSAYLMTSRERLRIFLPNAAAIPADEFPNVELSQTGNRVDTVPASPPYSKFRLHVIASIIAESIEAGGIISVSIPRGN